MQIERSKSIVITLVLTTEQLYLIEILEKITKDKDTGEVIGKSQSSPKVTLITMRAPILEKVLRIGDLNNGKELLVIK